MKIVREYINEKFVEDSDPIQDLGIGLFVKRDFSNFDDFFNFLLINIPAILRKKSMPKDMLIMAGFINEKYYEIIAYYINEYITFNGKSFYKNNIRAGDWPQKLRNLLIEKGFEREEIYDTDPIITNVNQ
jgi:hypothetical protein